MDQFKGQPRLPKFAVRKWYDIRLKPYLVDCKFAGSVAIDLNIVSKTKFIVLNAAELTVGAVSFAHKGSLQSRSSKKGGLIRKLSTFKGISVVRQIGKRFGVLPSEKSQVFEPCKVDLDEEDEILVLEFEQALPTGFGVLTIGFGGTLNDQMRGFYRSKYEHKGVEMNMAVTQFEAADARRCFPCWDEPACKATFKITVDVPPELVALSNMPVADTEVNGHTKTVYYQESPIMSTYLVAVVVGLFEYVEDRTSDGVKVRVGTRRRVCSLYGSAAATGFFAYYKGAYREELEYTVLSKLISVSSKVAGIAADARPELMGYMKQFFISLFHYSAEKLGWEAKRGESHLDAMLRGEILAALAAFGHEETRKEARRRFDAYLKDRSTPLLPPDVRKAAYVAVMQTVNSSNRSGYESLLRVYRETDLSEEKVRILGSLASCPDTKIIREVLDFMLSKEVRSQDAVHGLGVGREGREIAWSWLKEKWADIVQTYGKGSLISRFVTAVVSPFSSVEKAKEVEEFFSARPDSAITGALKKSLEQVRSDAQWVQSVRNEKYLAKAIQDPAYRK